METSIPKTRNPLDTNAQLQNKTEGVKPVERAGTSQLELFPIRSTEMNEVEGLKKLVRNFGNATADLIEQELRCGFHDPLGHKLRMNASFVALTDALNAASAFAEENYA